MKVLTKLEVDSFAGNIHRLQLWDFQDVEEEAFRAVSALRHYLNFSGVKALNSAKATLMAEHPGILQLDGLSEISEDVAIVLSKKKGGLWLNGLATVSELCAAALATHEGDLYLGGLKKISSATKKILDRDNIFYPRAHVKIE